MILIERCLFVKVPEYERCILDDGHSGQHEYVQAISISVDDTVEIKENLS